MIRILFLLLLILAVRWIFIRFIFPILKLTRLTHQKMNEMKDFMGQNKMKHNPKPEQKKPDKAEGEYIDYEEVK